MKIRAPGRPKNDSTARSETTKQKNLKKQTSACVMHERLLAKPALFTRTEHTIAVLPEKGRGSKKLHTAMAEPAPARARTAILNILGLPPAWIYSYEIIGRIIESCGGIYTNTKDGGGIAKQHRRQRGESRCRTTLGLHEAMLSKILHFVLSLAVGPVLPSLSAYVHT
jgi:hypothetical protein